jgi:type I restriction enzyme S subunit
MPTDMRKALPKGWKWVKLGEAADVISGSTPRTNVPEYWNGDIVWVTPADLSNLGTIEINDSQRKITKEGYESCSTTILPAGTVLLSSRAPIGHLAITGKEMCTNQGFKSLIPKKSLHSYYLYFVLKHLKERLISVCP